MTIGDLRIQGSQFLNLKLKQSVIKSTFKPTKFIKKLIDDTLVTLLDIDLNILLLLLL